MIDIPEYEIDNVVLTGSGEKISLKGEIDQCDPGKFLNIFFNDVLNQLPPKLEIDLRELNYLNSAAISSFLSFLLKAKQSAEIVIQIDRNKMWQRVSMDVVKSVDADRITLRD